MFKKGGPSYFGDLDEYGPEGADLLNYESAHERQGMSSISHVSGSDVVSSIDKHSPDDC
jgi:hypothetical protein